MPDAIIQTHKALELQYGGSPANVIQAIKHRDVEAVQTFLGYATARSWSCKRRKMNDGSVKADVSEGRKFITEALMMCVDPEKRSRDDAVAERSYAILEMVLKNGADVGYLDLCKCKANEFRKCTFTSNRAGNPVPPSLCDSCSCEFYKALNTFTRQSSWPRVCGIYLRYGLDLDSDYKSLFICFLASHNLVEVLKCFLDRGLLPIKNAYGLAGCFHSRAVSLEFVELLFKHKSRDFWSFPTIELMAVWTSLMRDARPSMLRLFIQNGLPPTDHGVIVASLFTHLVLTKAGTAGPNQPGPRHEVLRSLISLEFFQMLLDHANEDSSSIANVSVSQIIDDIDGFVVDAPPELGAARPELVKMLQDLPLKRIKSFAKPVEPSNPIIGEECAVCYDVYKKEEQIVTLPCKHIFHLDCMLETCKMKQDLCPYCRQRFI